MNAGTRGIMPGQSEQITRPTGFGARVSRYRWMLPPLILLGFSVGELYRHLLALVAIGGLVVTVRYWPWVRSSQSARLLGLLFPCLWIPMLASVPDAANQGAAVSVSLRYLMYLFAGLAMIRILNSPEYRSPILWGCFAVILLWVADGLFQHYFGVNLTGRELANLAEPGMVEQPRLTGMFEGSRLGFILAILAPIFLEGLRRLSDRFPLVWLMLVPWLFVILLAGSRVSWMLLVVGIAGYVAHRLSIPRQARVKAGRMVIPLLAAIAVILMTISQTQWLQLRFSEAARLATFDYEQANLATSERITPWHAAVRMLSAHPVNGVGVRNFGDVYDDFAPESTNPHHSQPHFFTLEIAAETGLIGLVGYAAFLILLLGRLWRSRQADPQAIPWGLAAVLAAFPLSATLSFFAHFMSALIWLLVILFIIASDNPGLESAAGEPPQQRP